VNNLDLIIDCTDKLLDQWRSTTDRDPNHIHVNIVDQCQNLSLAIFGFIGFDYDLQTLAGTSVTKNNKLRKALSDFLKIFLFTIPIPTLISRMYLKICPQYRQTMITISDYLKQIIEQEQRKTSEEITERKRTSLIASLVDSLQEDEKAEAMKPEQEKKGKYFSVIEWKSLNHFVFVKVYLAQKFYMKCSYFLYPVRKQQELYLLGLSISSVNILVYKKNLKLNLVIINSIV
jgi:hypothetical protein